MNKRRQRNVIIIGLSSIVLLMVIGYAAFQTVLNIQGTSKISSTWDVQITGITKYKTKGNITEIEKSTFDKETATFKVGLESPGDYIYYKVAVTNKGTLAAIAKLGNLTCGKSTALQCGAYSDSNVTDIGSNTDLTNRRLIIGPGETENYNVWIKYNSNITEQPDVTNIDIKLTLTYEQSDVGIIHTTEDKCYTGKVLTDGTLAITDYDKNCGTDIIIPETIDGYTVTEIQDGRWEANLGFVSAFANKKITSVVIPDTITYIGDNAFTNNQISSLKLSSALKHIGTEAFSGNRLTALELPPNLTTIKTGAFGGNNLTSVEIPDTVIYLGGGTFRYNNFPKENAIIYGRNSDGSIDYSTLDSCAIKDASNIELPQVINIASNACRTVKFKNLVIPDTVINIKSLAFSGSYIESLTLNENLKIIEFQAFEYGLYKNLVIPNSIQSIGSSAFRLGKLETVTIGSGIKTIGANAFQYSELASGTIHNPITSITINRKEGSVSGSPWGATKAQINWTGTN